MARLYAKVVGVTVLLVGIVGVIIGDPADGLLGLFNVDIVEDIIHLGTGGLLTYVGFAGNEGLVKNVVLGLGVVYLAVGLISIAVPELFGLIPHEYNAADIVLHLTLGVLGIGAAMAGAKGAQRPATTA